MSIVEVDTALEDGSLFGSVCLGCILVDSPQHGELTTSAGTNNMLAANGAVVNVGWLLNVVDCALTGLVVAAESPGIGLAILGNGEAVVRASGYRHNIGDA